jgi:hypothetical protein
VNQIYMSFDIALGFLNGIDYQHNNFDYVVTKFGKFILHSLVFYDLHDGVNFLGLLG